MKKKIILLTFLSIFMIAATAKYGTMWKRVGTTLSPADDITSVDLSGTGTSSFDVVSTTGNLIVGGNLDVNGDGPHTIFANLTGAGAKSGVDIDVTVNLDSGDAKGLDVDCIDTASPGNLFCLGVSIGGSDVFTVDQSGNIQADGNIQLGVGTTRTISGNTDNTKGGVQIAQTLDTTSDVYRYLFSAGAEMTASSGTQNYFSKKAVFKETGTARGNVLYQNISTVSEGSGGLYHAQFQTGRNDVFEIDDEGTTNISGGLVLPISSVTVGDSPVTVTTADYSFDCDASGGNVTFNLMSSSLVTGQGFEFTSTSTGKCILEGAGSETINGFATYTSLDAQYDTALIRSNGTNWTIKSLTLN